MIAVLISTCDRPQMLRVLLGQLSLYRGLHIYIVDDGRDKYPYPLPDNVFYRYEGKQRGKRRYYEVVNLLFNAVQGKDYDYYFFIQDDIILKGNFFREAIDIWKSAPGRIALNLYLDRGREGQRCWTRRDPHLEIHGDHVLWNSGWVDMACFMFDRSFLEEIYYHIDPISEYRWQKNKELSSGVGQQITRKLDKYTLYQVTTSLAIHAGNESKLNPERGFKFKDVAKKRIYASLATMPTRKVQLKETVKSLLPQVTRLYVYLNYTKEDEIPEYLYHKKITLYNVSRATDLGDIGKFYPYAQEKRAGYWLFCDDDIIYPKDYARKMVQKIDEYPGHIVCVHAAILKRIVYNYYTDRHQLNCNSFQANDEYVNIPGTGTMGIKCPDIEIPIDIFKEPNMADIWVGKYAQQNEIPIISISRPAGWMKIQVCDNTIYDNRNIMNRIIRGLVDLNGWKIIQPEPEQKEQPEQAEQPEQTIVIQEQQAKTEKPAVKPKKRHYIYVRTNNYQEGLLALNLAMSSPIGVYTEYPPEGYENYFLRNKPSEYIEYQLDEILFPNARIDDIIQRKIYSRDVHGYLSNIDKIYAGMTYKSKLNPRKMIDRYNFYAMLYADKYGIEPIILDSQKGTIKDDVIKRYSIVLHNEV